MLILLHISSATLGGPLLTSSWKGSSPQEEGCNSQHIVSSLQYVGVHGGTSFLPIPLSKHGNLSSLLTLYLNKRSSRLSWEDQIVSSPSFPATPLPCLLPINSEQGTEALRLWGGKDPIQTPLCLHRDWYNAATEVSGVMMYSLLKTQQKMETSSMENRVLNIWLNPKIVHH